LAQLLIALAVVLGVAPHAAAQNATSGPTVALDQYELALGQRVSLTISGFRSPSVTMAFCGNEGRRGSVDCNMQASQAREINADGTPTAAAMPVSAPPAPCPCILRVSSQDNSEIAVASITLVGHPVADVVGGSEFDQPLTVEIRAVVASDGLSREIRSSLGGATTYDVTIQVANRSTFAVDGVGLSSVYRRTRYDDVRTVEVPSVGRLAAGSTWEQVVQVEVPALTFGDIDWAATVSGAGPSVSGTDTTSQIPILLLVLVAVLLIDLGVLVWRTVVRVRGGRAPLDDPFVDGPGGTPGEDADVAASFDRPLECIAEPVS
jgi:hypothetical protein